MLVQHPGNRRKSLHLLRAFSSWRRQRQQKKKRPMMKTTFPGELFLDSFSSHQFRFLLPQWPEFGGILCVGAASVTLPGVGENRSAIKVVQVFFCLFFLESLPMRKEREGKKNLEPIRTSSRWETILKQAEDGNGKGSNWGLACNPGGVTCSPAVAASLLEVYPRSDSLWEKNHFLRITCQ